MWKSLSITKKIWVSLSILIIGYLISLLLVVVTGIQTKSRISDLSDQVFPAVLESQKALAGFNEQIKQYSDAVMFGEESLVETAQEKFETARNSLKIISELPGIDEDIKTDIINTIKLYDEFTESAIPLYKGMSTVTEDEKGVSFESRHQEDISDLANKTNALREKLIAFTKIFSDTHEATLALIQTSTRNMGNLNIGVFVVVVILAIFFIWIIIDRSITQPLNNTVSMIKDIAEGEGNLTKRLEVKSNDEVGELSMWFNSFIEKLQRIIKDIIKNAETLNISSANLSDLSELMNQGSRQMSEKANTVATSAEEMSTNMNSIASSMEQASTNTDMVASSVEEMTATINEIAEHSEKASSITSEAVTQAKNASDRIEKLGNAAQEIGKVTETITEISEQTNLLALNATIEAARAGDAGKGFAVVANEIKELARQTAEATQDIKEKIDSIQGTTSDAVTVIEKISKVINDVNEIVSTIATAVVEQSATTKEIASNVIQVSHGISEVNENVAQSSTVSIQIATDISEVNKATGDVSESSFHLNNSAKELSELAEKLKKMMAKFKV